MASESVIQADVLVVGGGMSGIFAAMKAREEGVNVALVDKGYVGKSGAVFIAGGAFSVFNRDWGHNLNEWKNQVAKVGDYMDNPEWTEICLQDSYERYKDLESWGVKFLRGEDDEPVVFRGGVFECGVLGSGWTYLPALRKQLLKSGVKIMDRTMVTDLLKQDGRVVGAVGFNIRSGDFYVFEAGAIVICTGGVDGEAMAYRAGAGLSNKEFFSGFGAYSYAGSQYYGDKGDGERVSIEGKEIKTAPVWSDFADHFIDKFIDAEGRKVNRYTMATAIHAGRGPILWNLDDATPKEKSDALWEIKQGGVGFKLERVGFDLNKGGVYRGMAGAKGMMMGGPPGCHGGGSGISAGKTMGSTGIPGLYAAGDNYNSRTVGAVYPFQGFSLRNASVVGTRAGQGAAEYAKKLGEIAIDSQEVARLKSSMFGPLERIGGFDNDWVTQQLRNIMASYYIYLVRKGDRLKAALTLVEFLKNHIAPKMFVKTRDTHGLVHVHETKNLIISAETALRAAIFRTESRGTHFREDYPRRDDPIWLAVVEVRESDGKADVVRLPFPKKWWPDLSIPYRERYPMEFPGEE